MAVPCLGHSILAALGLRISEPGLVAPAWGRLHPFSAHGCPADQACCPRSSACSTAPVVWTDPKGPSFVP